MTQPPQFPEPEHTGVVADAPRGNWVDTLAPGWSRPYLRLSRADRPDLPVTRRPRVAILATGDELVPPGTSPGPDQIIASNSAKPAVF